MAVKRCGAAPLRRNVDLGALVLAAGAGSRFGGGKLTALWRGGVLLDGALEAAFAAPAGRVVVVVGPDERVAAAALAFALAHGEAERMEIALAPDWSRGLSASLREGLRRLPDEVRGAFVFLGDMPCIPRGLAAQLAGALTDEVQAVQPVCDGTPGHPVLLGRALFEAAMRLDGDRGAQPLLQAPGVKVARVEVADAGVRLDVDTPQALASLATQQEDR